MLANDQILSISPHHFFQFKKKIKSSKISKKNFPQQECQNLHKTPYLTTSPKFGPWPSWPASLRQGWIDEAGAQEGLRRGLRPHRAEELLTGRGTEAGQHRSFAEVAEEDVLMALEGVWMP